MITPPRSFAICIAKSLLHKNTHNVHSFFLLSDLFLKGNREFRTMVAEAVPRYTTATSNMQKGIIVSSIINSVHSVGGRFLKQDGLSGNWIELLEQEAKAKVAHAIRDKSANFESQSRRSSSGSGCGGANTRIKHSKAAVHKKKHAESISSSAAFSHSHEAKKLLKQRKRHRQQNQQQQQQKHPPLHDTEFHLRGFMHNSISNTGSATTITSNSNVIPNHIQSSNLVDEHEMPFPRLEQHPAEQKNDFDDSEFLACINEVLAPTDFFGGDAWKVSSPPTDSNSSPKEYAV